jgi:hypothetical protein
LRDHDRNISEKGVKDAKLVAKTLTELELLPDLLLCSNSRRTKQTVEAMALENEHFDNIDSHFFGTLYTVAALDGQTRSHIAERVRVLPMYKQSFPSTRMSGFISGAGLVCCCSTEPLGLETIKRPWEEERKVDRSSLFTGVSMCFSDKNI